MTTDLIKRLLETATGLRALADAVADWEACHPGETTAGAAVMQLEEAAARIAELEAALATARADAIEEAVAWVRKDAGDTRETLRHLHAKKTLTRAQTEEWEQLIACKVGIADALANMKDARDD